MVVLAFERQRKKEIVVYRQNGKGQNIKGWLGKGSEIVL